MFSMPRNCCVFACALFHYMSQRRLGQILRHPIAVTNRKAAMIPVSVFE